MFLHDIVFTYMVIGGERDVGSGSIMKETSVHCFALIMVSFLKSLYTLCLVVGPLFLVGCWWCVGNSVGY